MLHSSCAYFHHFGTICRRTTKLSSSVASTLCTSVHAVVPRVRLGPDLEVHNSEQSITCFEKLNMPPNHIFQWQTLCQENCFYRWMCQAEPLNELFHWVSPSQAQFEFYSPWYLWDIFIEAINLLCTGNYAACQGLSLLMIPACPKLNLVS